MCVMSVKERMAIMLGIIVVKDVISKLKTYININVIQTLNMVKSSVINILL